MILSIGQALLILIEKYKHDKDKSNELKKLYLSGGKDSESKGLLKMWLKDEALSKHKVSDQYHIIDEDPVRRYFETHLAYETLLNSLDLLSIDLLKKYYEDLLSVTGKFQEESIDNQYMEYKDAIYRLKSNEYYQDFSLEHREKLELLIRISFLGLFNVTRKDLPLNIYEKGVFFPENRGRKIKTENKESSSRNLGIIKSYMPLPQSDVAFSKVEISHQRAVDQSNYRVEAQWVIDNFDLGVHPFCNSISGTMLCQLRNLKFLETVGIIPFDIETLTLFIRCFTSAMIFNSGGHTFHEFFGSLFLKDVRDAFSFLNDFQNLSEEILILNNNQKAFDKALEDAFIYNESILMRKKLHKELPSIPKWFFLKIQNEKKNKKEKAIIKNIDSLISSLKTESNFHIEDLLNSYIEIKKEEINDYCKRNNLDKLDKLVSLSTYEKFLESLKSLDFTLNSGEILNDTQLAMFFLQKVSSIKDIPRFMQEVVDPNDKKGSVLSLIAEVKKNINLYEKKGKSHFIKSFNEEIDLLTQKIGEQVVIDKDKIEEKLEFILNDLQMKEDNYYKGLTFFQDLRKSHSGLQPLLKVAIDLKRELKELLLEEDNFAFKHR